MKHHLIFLCPFTNQELQGSTAEAEGIADLIESGHNGFLVPPDDPDAIAQVIEQCLADPKEADQIADRGYESAIGLTWEKNAAEYIALYERLLR